MKYLTESLDAVKPNTFSDNPHEVRKQILAALDKAKPFVTEFAELASVIVSTKSFDAARTIYDEFKLILVKYNQKAMGIPDQCGSYDGGCSPISVQPEVMATMCLLSLPLIWTTTGGFKLLSTLHSASLDQPASKLTNSHFDCSRFIPGFIPAYQL